jgi:hypothetical protein
MDKNEKKPKKTQSLVLERPRVSRPLKRPKHAGLDLPTHLDLIF